MKRTELAKAKALKLVDDLARRESPDRFATQSSVPDRKAKRKLDQAKGLIPFAVKINGSLVARVRARAVKEGISVDELVENLLQHALSGE